MFERIGKLGRASVYICTVYTSFSSKVGSSFSLVDPEFGSV